MSNPDESTPEHRPEASEIEDAEIVVEPNVLLGQDPGADTSEPPPNVVAPDPFETARSDPPAGPQRQSGGVIALLLGGVLAAGAGFGLSRLVPEGWPIPATQNTALTDQLAAQTAEISKLKSALAELPPPADLAPLAARIAAAEEASTAAAGTAASALDAAKAAQTAAAVAVPSAAPDVDLAARLDLLDARIAALEAAPPVIADSGGDPAASAQLRQELAALREELAAQKAASADAVEAVKTNSAQTVEAVKVAAAEAQAGLAAAQAEAETLRAAAEAQALAARMQAAVSRVQSGVANGTPFASAVDELVAGGITVPAALVAKPEGVPSLAALRAAFPDAARAALTASLKADPGDTLTDRLGAFLRTQTSARSLEPREGSDPDAVLSRAEAALGAGDLPKAVAELTALPEAGQAAMAGWLAKAKIRLDAEAAIAELAAIVGGQ